MRKNYMHLLVRERSVCGIAAAVYSCPNICAHAHIQTPADNGAHSNYLIQIFRTYLDRTQSISLYSHKLNTILMDFNKRIAITYVKLGQKWKFRMEK